MKQFLDQWQVKIALIFGGSSGIELAAAQWLAGEGRLTYGYGDETRLVEEIAKWEKATATHLSLNTLKMGLQPPKKYLAAINKFPKSL